MFWLSLRTSTRMRPVWIGRRRSIPKWNATIRSYFHGKLKRMRLTHSRPTPSHRISTNSTNGERFVGTRLVFRHWCPDRNMAENSIVLATVANCCAVCRPHCCAIALHVFPVLVLFVPALLVVSVYHTRRTQNKSDSEREHKGTQKKRENGGKKQSDNGENQLSSNTVMNYLYKIATGRGS